MKAAIQKMIEKYDYLVLFCACFIFFLCTINGQKLEFYNLQNALVETLVEQKSFGMKGIPVGAEYFTNTQTKTPQLSFIGDVFYYHGLFYPQKTYGAHYWSSIVYMLLKIIGLSFATHYLLVSKILLIASSYLLAGLGITLTYITAKKITHSRIIGIFASISLGFGSLLTGGINVRNEETFGYWLLIIALLLTFSSKPSRLRLTLQLFLTYYALFSLPAITLLLPFLLYKIYTHAGNLHKRLFITLNLLFIGLIFLNNYLIFHRLTYSTYIIGVEAAPAYKRSFFEYDPVNFGEKLGYYFINPKTMVFSNYPLLLFALFGIVMAQRPRLEKMLLLITLGGFAFYISNLRDDAWVGYGSGRYALGLFPLTYVYLIYWLHKRHRSLLILLTGIAAAISIYKGLFFYFAPVRNVYEQSTGHLSHLPLREHFLLLVVLIVVGGLTFMLLLKKNKLASFGRTNEII